MAHSIPTTDQIRKQVSLDAPRSRVWQALTDSTQFGTWFGVKLNGPFQVGCKIDGEITHEGCDKALFEAWVERIEPETDFSFRWHPYGIDKTADLSKEPTTLVEFHLEDEGDGTRLTVVESGFDALPDERRAKAFEMNEGGWTYQMGSIKSFVDG